MKKLLIAVLLLSPVFSMAQSNTGFASLQDGKHFLGGLTLGLNASQVDGDDFSGFHSAGLNAGGLVYWFFAKDVAASMEFLFSQKGSHGVRESYSPYGGAYYAKYKMRLNYIEVPVVLHYLFKEKYLAGIGGSFNALLSAKESMEDAGYYAPINPDDYPFNNITFDIMASIGIFLGNNFIAEARYQYGITPLRNSQHVAPFMPGMGERDQFNNMFAFRLIYLF